jgi:hypothetical protein
LLVAVLVALDLVALAELAVAVLVVLEQVLVLLLQAEVLIPSLLGLVERSMMVELLEAMETIQHLAQ